MPSVLTIEDLHVSVNETPILRGVNLELRQGEIHALMGPNGSGKSTLAYVLVGHPKYEVTQGRVLIDGQDIAELDPCQRAVVHALRHAPAFCTTALHRRGIRG